MMNVKLISNGAARPFVSDHANTTAPTVGPTALKALLSVMLKPLTRPRWAATHELLMIRKTVVKQMLVALATSALCASSNGTWAGGGASAMNGRQMYVGMRRPLDHR